MSILFCNLADEFFQFFFLGAMTGIYLIAPWFQEIIINCKGSGKNIGKCYGGEFSCPDCGISWATSEIGEIIVPDHAKHCDHDSDNDYCKKCGAPQGSMCDLIYSEWEDQLGRGYDGYMRIESSLL